MRSSFLTIGVALVLSEFVVKGNTSNIPSESDQGFTTGAIGCYRCTTFNGSDVGCTDPFHPVYSTFEEECYQGKKDRQGLFPAKYCLKIHGKRIKDNVDIFIRTCSTTGMGDFCGEFDYDGDMYHGCIRTCQTYACNHGITRTLSSYKKMEFLITTLLCFASFHFVSKWWRSDMSF